MNWAMVAALGTWTAVIGGVLYGVVRLEIRTEIAAAMKEAVKEINGTYIRANKSGLTGHEIETRLTKLESRRA